MSALDELRENLREAARRDVDANRGRLRRRHRRATGFVVLALLGGAAAAGAADLISVGEPVENLPEQSASYRPPDGEHFQIALKARSGHELPIAVATYTARNGEECAVAGYVRGTALGRLENGKFRPYEAGRSGACRRPGLRFADQFSLGDRTIVFGRVPPEVRSIGVPGRAKPVPPGPDGAFLFVFERDPDGGLIRVDFRE